MLEKNNSKGYYKKFIVSNSDGTLVEEDTFVLKWSDEHARKALMCYAQSIKKDNPNLYVDIVKKLRETFKNSTCPEEDYSWIHNNSVFTEKVFPSVINICNEQGQLLFQVERNYDPDYVDNENNLISKGHDFYTIKPLS